VDTVIQDNHLHNCSKFGVWLDWMAQGTMVLGNLVHDTSLCTIFTEVDHGPVTMANNIFLAPEKGLCHNSAGNAYAHNLITGVVANQGPDARQTPSLVPHETDIVAVVRAVNGDHRMYNNHLVAPAAFAAFDGDFLPCMGSGNVYTGAGNGGPSSYETGALVDAAFNAGVTLTEEAGGMWMLQYATDSAWATHQTRALVDTALLGSANITRQPYTLPSGAPLVIDVDYFGKARDQANPFPGPFEAAGAVKVQVWPKP
jgi:alpha-N-arabinofuranosidase